MRRILVFMERCTLRAGLYRRESVSFVERLKQSSPRTGEDVIRGE